MRKTITGALVVLVLTLAAYVGMAAQTQRMADRYEPGIYLPQVPLEGDRIRIEGRAERCTVVAVLREWVRCGESDTVRAARSTGPERIVWHNVYNGHTYDVEIPRR